METTEKNKQNSLGLLQDKQNYSNEKRVEMQRSINGTPFKTTMVEDKYQITFGKYVVCSKSFEKIEDAEEYIETNEGMWDVIVGLSGVAVTEAIVEIEKRK